MQLATLLGIFGSVFGVVATLGAAYAVWRYSSSRAQLTELRNDRDDLIKRNEIHRQELGETKAELTEERAQRKALESRVQALESVVTAKEEIARVHAAIVDLAETVHEHARGADERHRMLYDAFRLAHRDEVNMIWEVRGLMGDARKRPPRTIFGEAPVGGEGVGPDRSE